MYREISNRVLKSLDDDTVKNRKVFIYFFHKSIEIKPSNYKPEYQLLSNSDLFKPLPLPIINEEWMREHIKNPPPMNISEEQKQP